QQTNGHWFPHDIASSDHDTFFSIDFHAGTFHKLNDPCRSTRQESIFTDYHISYADRMKSIYILFRIDCKQNFILVDMLWKRKLHQDAVDRGILIAFLYNLH